MTSTAPSEASPAEAPPADSSPGDPTLERRRLLVLATAALIVEVAYIFFVSAGTFRHWHFYIAYLNDLADGFRQGHLHLSVEPARELLAKPNPADGTNFWYWDASLYHGHFYFYWGPVPALLLAAVKTAFRMSTAVGDERVVFALATLQLCAGVLFIERAGRRLFARTPLILEVTAIFVLGLCNPALYNLARAAVYEAAIVGGHAFILLGLVFAFDAVCDRQLGRGRLVAAGASWAAAVGCRISLGPAVALLALVTILGAAAGRPRRLVCAIRAAIWLGLPLALGLFALLGYNRLRFDAWFEFGRQYQLSWIQTTPGRAFIRPNLRAYLLRPPLFSCRFPFVYAPLDFGARAFPPGYELPPGYFVYEQVFGVLRGLPWCALALPALAATARSIRRQRTLGPASWAVLATGIAATVSIIPGMTLPSATNRYLGDVAGALALLGALGAFSAVAAARRPWVRKLVIGLTLLLALPSIGVGLALGIKGQYVHFQANNPPLYDKLVRHLSVCHGEIPPEPK
jgi:hypothetical protein